MAAQQNRDDGAVYRILVINPGSTSTKLALFANEQQLAEQVIRHAPDAFDGCASLLEQKPLRMACLMQFLRDQQVDMGDLAAVVGRGGLIRPIASGTYTVNDKMLADLATGEAGAHASSLGAIMAAELGKQYGIPAFIVDPVVVDEREPVAKISGLPQIERKSIFHALNTKAVARICTKQLGLRYEDARLVVAHLGGGVSVGAHRYGRVIDVNDALCGEGPFSPERSGGLPLYSFIELCFSGEYTKQQMQALVSKQGGMKAYLGSNDLLKVEQMINEGDGQAALVAEAMAYQTAKEIGAMVAVLEGRVDAIILTGGLAYSLRFTGAIKQHVDKLAPVLTYPGENEMPALAAGGLRVLRGEEAAREY